MHRPAGTLFLIVGGIASLVVIGVGYFYFDRRNDPEAGIAVLPFQNIPEDSIQISDVTGDDPTIVDIVKKVSRHLVLPDGRVTVVTITNLKALLQENPVFYRFAKAGDKVLIYQDRAILYNPDIDKVLDVWHVSEPIAQPTQ